MSIQVKDLFFSYNFKTPFQSDALNGINLNIDNHCFTAFVGQTGSGKSTLMQTFNALIKPTSGEIIVDNFIINKKRKSKKVKALRKHVGLVFQFPEYQLFEETVLKDVSFGVKNFGVKDPEATELAKKALLSVGIDESYFGRSPFELSGGERRRIALAGILAINPDILILDEPTVGLDPKGCSEILSLIQSMYDNGTSIILVTHDMDVVMKYCHQVFVLKNGKIVFEGQPYQLFESNVDDMSIEVPPLFKLAKQLKNRGFAIDFASLRTTDDLIEQLRRNKNE